MLHDVPCSIFANVCGVTPNVVLASDYHVKRLVSFCFSLTLSTRSRMCRLSDSAISSGLTSAGPKSDLELEPLGLAPEHHISSSRNDSRYAQAPLMARDIHANI